MLVHDYFYYLSRISGAALFTVWGIVAVALLALALFWLIRHKAAFGAATAALALLSFTIGIYAAEYEIPEDPARQHEFMNDEGWESCGVGRSRPTPSGYGMSNPCEWGCFRGATRRKIMTMGEFPPWPKFQREVECWRRTGPWKPPPAKPAADAPAPAD
jgi:hypothetical protein